MIKQICTAQNERKCTQLNSVIFSLPQFGRFYQNGQLRCFPKSVPPTLSGTNCVTVEILSGEGKITHRRTETESDVKHNGHSLDKKRSAFLVFTVELNSYFSLVLWTRASTKPRCRHWFCNRTTGNNATGPARNVKHPLPLKWNSCDCFDRT